MQATTHFPQTQRKAVVIPHCSIRSQPLLHIFWELNWHPNSLGWKQPNTSLNIKILKILLLRNRGTELPLPTAGKCIIKENVLFPQKDMYDQAG